MLVAHLVRVLIDAVWPVSGYGEIALILVGSLLIAPSAQVGSCCLFRRSVTGQTFAVLLLGPSTAAVEASTRS
jgi:hypothetical protein